MSFIVPGNKIRIVPRQSPWTSIGIRTRTSRMITSMLLTDTQEKMGAMSKVIVSLNDTPWKLIVYIALTFVCFLSCLGLNISCDEFTVADWSNSNSDVLSVEIHWNGGYTSDTEEEEKGRLIVEIHRDVHVQSRSSSSTLPPPSTSSTSSCDFSLINDDNLARHSGQLSFSSPSPSASSNAGSLSCVVNLNDTSDRDLSLGAVLESGISHEGIQITESYKDFEVAQSAMKRGRKERIKSTVTEKYPPPCNVFVEGIPKDWNENQVKTACHEHDMNPLHVQMCQQKGTGMCYFIQRSLSIDFQCLAIITFGDIHVEDATYILSEFFWEGRYIKARESSVRPTRFMNNREKARLRTALKNKKTEMSRSKHR